MIQASKLVPWFHGFHDEVPRPQEERRAVLLQQLTKWFGAEAKEALEYIVPGLNGVDVPGRLVDGGILVRLLRVQYMEEYGMHKRPTFPEGHYWSNHISRFVSQS